MAPKHNQLFIIGGQRSGTTFLTNLLDQHPQIKFATPIFPETKFFIRNPEANADSFYETFFSDVVDGVVVAEKSTSYFEYDKALTAIASNFSNALILFIYRDPAKRAVSNFKFSRKNGLETRSAEDVFLRNTPSPERPQPVSVNPFDYLGRSKYSSIIPRIEGVFSAANLMFIDFDLLINDCGAVVNQVFELLGVDSTIQIRSSVAKNESAEMEVSSKVLKRLNELTAEDREYLERRFK